MPVFCAVMFLYMDVHFMFPILDMPFVKPDLYAAQISSNIFELTNFSPIPFEIKSIFCFI